MSGAPSTPPIVSGNGSFTFEYVGALLHLPAGAAVLNAHGLVQDADGSIILAYEPEHTKDKHCLVRWTAGGTQPRLFGADSPLCAGTPHGLRLAVEENGRRFLYHANNDMALHKTHLNGSLVWSLRGPPGGNASFLPFKPTWFATPPGSKYIYLADGYGSNLIHVYDRQGTYSGRFFGGRGIELGLFQTCHAINFDPRTQQLIVSDRENHRHQSFDFNRRANDPSEVTFMPKSSFLTPGISRPCHIRFFAEGQGISKEQQRLSSSDGLSAQVEMLGHAIYAIVPSLDGSVGILDSSNALVSRVEVAKLLGAQGHLHPHDAIVLDNGDMAVATWNPGRVSYWRRKAVESNVLSFLRRRSIRVE
eukprot:scaffold250025_cov36-Tisochrysis_lutea.AAC.1